ncbi:C40 family peptidase [uncultured Draconibacterium sp.]|uniref:C40 family peptidase n=1 Tax=uncultured Draconibacterium sp. TaxID=1573823 RepID=UPI0025F84CFD|nr:C40 family peptidase [uncultured Draconibacterium sp.]
MIQDIQQANIPDKRLEYFNVDVETQQGKNVLSGTTVSEKAYADLQNLAEEKSLDFNVELLPAEKFKENPWAIVTLSVCNVRGAASHSAELVTQAVMGTPVKVYMENGGWFLIQTPDCYFGWVDAAGIALKTNAELAEWKALEKVLYKKQNGFAYAEADNDSEIEFDLVLTNLLSVVNEENGFYKIVLADGRKGFVDASECVSLDIWKKKRVTAEEVLATAFKFKGVPYLWGGTSAKMVDCSGFVKSGFYLHGLILQRDASQQTFYGELVDTEKGYDILQPCDLVFFGKKATGNQKERVTHVGMVIDGSEFIHASGKVRINSLNRNSEKYTAYYETAFVRARKVLGNVDGKGIEWVIDNEFYKEILP